MKNNKNKVKGIIVAICLGAATIVTGITGVIVGIVKNNRNADKKPKDVIESVVEDDKTLEDLGFAEEDTDTNVNNSVYEKTTGDVDKNKVVEKDNTVWKDQEAADKSNEVGKTTIDDKDGTLTVQPNGTVTEKDKGYEVKDENGNTTQSGSNETGIPEGYVWDAEVNAYVPANEAGLYTYADATYYNEKGEVVIEKGMKVLKTTLEKAKKYCTTTKPTTNKNTTNNNTTNRNTTNNNTTNNNTTSNTETNSVSTEVKQEDGVLNPDGTYTIYGVTYMDKATFEAFVLDENSLENFGFDNNIIYPKSVIDEMNAQRTK